MSTLSAFPDAAGRFGPYGGRYVPETLIAALEQLEAEYDRARSDPAFGDEFAHYLKVCVNRPSPLYFAERLTQRARGARIYLKRKHLNPPDPTKITTGSAPAPLARRREKPPITPAPGAGHRGAATATACALFGLPCEVYMGAEDVRRQKLNVFKMHALGSKVV